MASPIPYICVKGSSVLTTVCPRSNPISAASTLTGIRKSLYFAMHEVYCLFYTYVATCFSVLWLEVMLTHCHVDPHPSPPTLPSTGLCADAFLFAYAVCASV